MRHAHFLIDKFSKLFVIHRFQFRKVLYEKYLRLLTVFCCSIGRLTLIMDNYRGDRGRVNLDVVPRRPTKLSGAGTDSRSQTAGGSSFDATTHRGINPFLKNRNRLHAGENGSMPHNVSSAGSGPDPAEVGGWEQ